MMTQPEWQHLQLAQLLPHSCLLSHAQERDAAWGEVLKLAPDNYIAWSNRGTVRLQQGL